MSAPIKRGWAWGIGLAALFAVLVLLGTAAAETATKTAYITRTGTAATFTVPAVDVGTSATSLGTLDVAGYDWAYVLVCNDSSSIDLTNLTLLVKYNPTDSAVTFYDSTDWATASDSVPFISSGIATLGAGTCGAFHARAMGQSLELKGTVGSSTASVRWSGVLAGD